MLRTAKESTGEFRSRIFGCISVFVIFILCASRFLIPLELYDLGLIESLSTLAVLLSFGYFILSSIYVHLTVVHTYILFVCCMALFVGGRFIAHAIGFDLSILGYESSFYSVERPGFIRINLSASDAVELTYYILTCLHAIHSGYMLSISIRPPNFAVGSSTDWRQWLKLPSIAISVISVLLFVFSFSELYRNVNAEGYTSLYRSSGTDFTMRASTAAQYGLLLSLGLAIASKSRILECITLLLLAVYYFASLRLGIRGGVMGYALFCVWLFHVRVKRIDVFALFCIPAILFAILVGSMVGARNLHFGNNTSIFLPWFIDNQGLTALYIFPALQVTDYPSLAYLQSIFPIAPAISALLGGQIPLDHLYFGQYLSKISLSGDAYHQGFGMGWSVLSDFYAYTHWIPGMYIFAAAAFGLALGKLVNATGPLLYGAHLMIFVKIMLLPRTGLYSVMPFLLVYALIVGSCYYGSKIFGRYKLFEK